ncbi:hypothetical protein A2313_04320 [Candidatus Roizmanbacteria bacterium RIFOXYB2_FULL_41_10]|uniref:tRNA carboxymethyluridine synthase n=1 Tax=Candidatus Roizmanbacteria bacterium RIFOXYA1_FULL_41_12 TaxID=1802082 RepID=A0A1F7KFF3_9BACT|nr:MAG: hypothetical protein A2262_00305 [Candidatus Roizmanbacteria bacterium RIFOXYA2_FULL_41_8]OGK66586.1 MAG: hypothetical protein A2209_00780 [Candidatus Roizmanbacteria bacterium RIFOXYA1_FULL_41_12]OGK67079.1 MAG: hypothetical protein A2377_03640 [Candidatus Roizmanbacteria bacterium RIFOXYB1_FULL_41_27]OGK69402.1 MAG: hypothetical protein A2403_04150 [Candidatus Roizmanbacteria bacterium RIFOXYC1_FULL_41_16]OGK72175.1 MAG: hypothetical protein A2313_04320 [Candidatus Roizmanbacteria bac
MRFVLERHQQKFNPAFYQQVNKLLIKTRVRSASGIVPVSVFTNGVGCPFNCVYCSNEPDMPKSYFSDEPAVMRAIRNHFDPYKQVQSRLQMLYLSGHSLDKIELIIQGGTFSFYDKPYREWFVRRCFDAANTNVAKLIKTGNTTVSKSIYLSQAQRKNETTSQRIIGLTVETRPDFINPKEIKFLRTLGVTRVEIGVQAPDEKILKLINRGHGLKEIVYATKLLKNAGIKITFHLMPGLPGSNYRKDLKMLREIFQNPNYKPDNIKFYPTSVVKYSKLEKWYQQGNYQPLDEKTLTKLILAFKKTIVPPWVRIQRLVRDLTVNDIVVDSFPSNLRQKIETELKKQKIRCQCIRCREIKSDKKSTRLKLEILTYSASDGQEYFLQYIDSQNRLYGLLRLRLFDNQAIVRELHVYGEVNPIGKRDQAKTQHAGLGQNLLYKAEQITKKHHINQLAIIAGIGAREYYRHLGYRLKNTYMLKSWQ